ncbi:MAG: dihydroorotate dehydrogenase-like protein [Dysgonamonadaceae bacterium]|jgi:dihydroorotate dehydrogenase (fumarate)|nr:dihydroorotate dehydrogenase-like protein [Dysgonamonadaceae bacterium]MDD3355807.1 dihydroorotate dehydrogenase-like protein [Dysgonamonadaceae bacterium]MDD3728431.1 dihydroorotate dehydrogenase-like protein [Dysgonamonadaceae bacterium]MDD4246202.1 dihydroorotate dehydrogenase-like protein [Dysgonamonadaceae bacterium]MDD4604895.1 dihydroorotate dehydrogenase-like protein [Dysgonamonadaceae bacterium]
MMKNLKTTYMGIELKSPIILGACNMSDDIDKLMQAEKSGVGAIVFKSLFEEQIQLERLQFEERLTQYDHIHAQMITTHPRVEYADSEKHLVNLRKVKEKLSVPIIASLNAVHEESWLEYATELASTGVDGLELNLYQVPLDFDKDAREIEESQINIVRKIKEKISLPISVKLSSDYTNVLGFIKKMDEVGVDGLVLFNSFFQPDIDVDSEKHKKIFNLSQKGDYRKSLRYAGLLYGNIKADVCSSRGIFTGNEVVKHLLSGAACIQMVSAVYKKGLEEISVANNQLSDWMKSKGYNSIDEFRGKLSQKSLGADSLVYRRAQYVDLLLSSETIFGD